MRIVKLLCVLALVILFCDVAAAAETISLPQSITAEYEHFTVDYPADWVAQAIRGGVVLANSAAAMANYAEYWDEMTLEAGQFIGTVDLLLAEGMYFMDDPLGAPINELLDGYLDMVGRQMLELEGESPLLFADVESVDYNGREIAIALGAYARSDGTFYDLAFIFGRVEDQIAQTIFIGDFTDYETQRDVMAAITVSVRPIPEEDTAPVVVDLTGEFTSTDGSLTVRYQTDWVAGPAGLDDQILLANHVSVLDTFAPPLRFSLLPERRVAGMLAVFSEADIPGTGTGADVPLTGVTNMVAAMMLQAFSGTSGEIVNMEDAVAYEVDGIDVAIVTGVTRHGFTLDVALVLAVIGDDYGLGFFVAAEGEMAQYVDILTATVASMQHNPPG